jgi:ATP-dependent DNA helicase RecG
MQILLKTNQELEALLADLESEIAERKATFSGDVATRARQAVCAFANDLPGRNVAGVLFIGANDDGSPSGIMVTDELLRDISDMKTDGRILPSPVLSVEKRRLFGADMVVVIVAPSDLPPVKFDGGTWIRVGPRRAIATPQEERMLSEKRRSKNLPFDLYPIRSAGLADLSRPAFEDDFLPAAFAPEILASNGRSYEEKLASCRMVVSPDDPTPTLSGLLALGRDPQRHLPGARVQFLRIAGRELADPIIDELDCRGPLPALFRAVEAKMAAHNRTAYDVESGPTHTIKSDYPMVALQQILYNAVLHRTYENTHAPVRVDWFDDRVEISNPGGPYGVVTVENFGQPGYADYRNPNLAAILKVFGFVQQFGRGIGLARRHMAQNGNPPPEFRVSASSVVCVLRKA